MLTSCVFVPSVVKNIVVFAFWASTFDVRLTLLNIVVEKEFVIKKRRTATKTRRKNAKKTWCLSDFVVRNVEEEFIIKNY